MFYAFLAGCLFATAPLPTSREAASIGSMHVIAAAMLLGYSRRPGG